MSVKTTPTNAHTAPGNQVDEQRDLVDLLHRRGQRVTSQRLVTIRELRRRRHHATAEEIHRAVHRELPGVSVPTIYATLDLFVELGLARRIDTGARALYDAGLEPHQHAVCRRCGRVVDVDGQIDAGAFLKAAQAAGFQPQGAELIISGLCAECARAA
jgi:Fur family ferric uptake transcriptional regulator/Fur family peroxide stress response transcriptional regulator